MNESESFDWIGILILVFFLVFPLLNLFLKKKPPLQKKVPPRPPVHHPMVTPKKKVMKMSSKPPPAIPTVTHLKKTKKVKKSITTKYGSIKNGVIFSEILKRPYWD